MSKIREIAYFEACPLLEETGLYPVDNADCRIGIFDDDEELIATAALVGDMVQMVAVSPAYSGEDLAAAVVSQLIMHAMRKGIPCLHLFTKSANRNIFEGIGFSTVACVEDAAALMEWGRPGINEYLGELAAHKDEKAENAGAIVMNCNPFSLGHRHLTEYAAERCDRLYILVLEEDISEFPFDVRLELARRATADLDNVTVIPGGRYVISSLTFPAYFARDAKRARIQAQLDTELFCRYIAPALGIKRRFLGQEPFSESTAIYNSVLLEKAKGVEIGIIPRLERNGRAISASEVRRLIREGDTEAACALLPETSAEFIRNNAERVKQWMKGK